MLNCASRPETIRTFKIWLRIRDLRNCSTQIPAQIWNRVIRLAKRNRSSPECEDVLDGNQTSRVGSAGENRASQGFARRGHWRRDRTFHPAEGPETLRHHPD